MIDRQATQLAKLVDDLLDVTRFTRDKIRLQKQRLEINELVRRAVEDNRSFFERNEVRLSCDLAPARCSSMQTQPGSHRWLEIFCRMQRSSLPGRTRAYCRRGRGG